MQTKYKYETSGRSMIEIIGALAVMSLVSAAAISLVRMGSASQKRTRTFDDIMTIVANIRSMYPDGFSLLDRNHSNNKELVGAIGFTETPFGSDTSYAVAGENADKFSVLILGLDDDDCTVLAAQTWPGAFSASCNNGDVYLMFGA